MQQMLISVDSDLLDDRQSLYVNVFKKEAEILARKKNSIAEAESKLISSLFVTEKRTQSQIREETYTYQIGVRRRKRR